MANIKNELNNIKSAVFGKDVRKSIHDGIDTINKEVESTTNRQTNLENTFDQLIINAGNSNAEIVDARVKSDGTSYSKLGDRLDVIDLQLAHIPNNFVNVEVYGITPDNEDCAELFQKMLDDGHKNIVFGKGEYNFKTSINVWDNVRIIGDSRETTTFKFLGEGTFIYFKYKNIEISDIKILSSLGRNSDTQQIGLNLNSSEKSNYNCNIKNCIIDGFSYRGISLYAHWQINIDNCYIARCGKKYVENAGGIVIYPEGDVLANWSGSGDLFTNNYIVSCENGILNYNGWNVSVINNIFEYCTVPINNVNSNCMVVQNCWFEYTEDIPIVNNAKMIIVGGRAVSYRETSNSKLLYINGNEIYSNNFSVDNNGVDLNLNLSTMGYTSLKDEEGNAKAIEFGKPIYSVKGGIKSSFESAFSLDSKTNYWGINDSENAKVTSSLELGASGGAAGNGRSNGEIRFNIGNLNGSEYSVPYYTKLSIKNDGLIYTNKNGVPFTIDITDEGELTISKNS